MKKIALLLVVLILAISVSGFCACSIDEDEVLKEVSVKQYYEFNSFNSIQYSYFEVTNNSKYDLEITVNVEFYNDDNQMVGTDSQTQAIVESGQTTLFDFYAGLLMTSTRAEYELSVKKAGKVEPVCSDFGYEIVENGLGATVTITNNGDKDIEYFDGIMLFFKDGKLVDSFSENYYDLLKPGKSLTTEYVTFEDFDSYKFFLVIDYEEVEEL